MMPSTPVVYHSPQPRLLDHVREVIRFKHYSSKTEEAYVDWVRYFIKWNGRQGQMRPPRIELLLTKLLFGTDMRLNEGLRLRV